MGSNAYVLQPSDGRSIDLGNFQMIVKAESSQTAGAFTLLEATEPPHFGPPMHIHRDAAEAFYVLEGEYSCSWSRTSSGVRPDPSCTYLLAPFMGFESDLSSARS